MTQTSEDYDGGEQDEEPSSKYTAVLVNKRGSESTVSSYVEQGELAMKTSAITNKNTQVAAEREARSL